MPAASNVPGAESPRIHRDGRVTFTLRAPEANSPQIAGGDGLGNGPFPYYWFVLGGVSSNDPGSSPGERLGASLRGPFDTKTAFDGVLSDPAKFNGQIKLLWFGAGSKEPQLHANVSDTVDTLRRSGIRVVFFESSGTAQEWQMWRRSLYDLAPRLFR